MAPNQAGVLENAVSDQGWNQISPSTFVSEKNLQLIKDDESQDIGTKTKTESLGVNPY